MSPAGFLKLDGGCRGQRCRSRGRRQGGRAGARRAPLRHWL